MGRKKKLRGKSNFVRGCLGLIDEGTRRDEAASSDCSVDGQSREQHKTENNAVRGSHSQNQGTHITSKLTSGAETKTKSQVGSAMRELTGQRVAVVIIVSLLLAALLSFKEKNSIIPKTMTLLHGQTTNPVRAEYAWTAVDIAKNHVVPQLYNYENSKGENQTYYDMNTDKIRKNDILIVNVTINGDESNYSVGYFNKECHNKEKELLTIFLTLFITIVWFFGVAAFAGPVMYLVVIPIERMIRLLTMLMKDPLGYQSTRRYMTFMSEEDQFTQNSTWTKDVLKGMETSFLMSTILRIGSLMKVGFGSAGVDIIRKNLEKGLKRENAFKNLQGSTVSCIFLFSDIRQFTDATECLQEEVFVFTNKIAEVVHSICNSYGGAANKNIGDAFLLSWALDCPSRVEKTSSSSETNNTGHTMFQRRSSPAPSSARLGTETLIARHNQADKALLSVVKICVALHNDDFFMESLSEVAQNRLKDKLQKSPIVQMGFGLHAGKAVQGAIGSQRKIDATYISKAVELSEVLEGLTKRYSVEMLMSGQFHSLLQESVAGKCRKIDQVIVNIDDEDEECPEDPEEDNILKLYTYDMDIDAYYNKPSPGRKSKTNIYDNFSSDTKMDLLFGRKNSKSYEHDEIIEEFILPSGSALYHADIWTSAEFRRIRSRYEGAGKTFPFLQSFKSGLKSYYQRDWEAAHGDFSSVLARHDDGPSQYFLGIIEKNKKIPPRNFRKYGSIH